jgi:hypothetical protein
MDQKKRPRRPGSLVKSASCLERRGYFFFFGAAFFFAAAFLAAFFIVVILPNINFAIWKIAM